MNNRSFFLLCAALGACAGDPETTAEQPAGAETAAGPSDEVPTAPPPAATDADAPPGWMLAGVNPDAYRIDLDTSVVHGGQQSARITAIGDTSKGFATLSQRIEARNYAASRVRLSAWVRLEKVEAWAGLWMRVDVGKTSAAFDNMQNRPLVGTRDWQRVEVVLDVDPSADAILFGLLLDGRGTVWIDDVALEKVGTEVPTTDMTTGASLPDGPQNLGFTG
jgi:hypothetical protein